MPVDRCSAPRFCTLRDLTCYVSLVDLNWELCMPGVPPTCFKELPAFYKKPYKAMVRRARNASSTPPSEDWYFKQLCAQDWRCELTGIEFNDKVANWDDTNQSRASYWVPSIDRI